MSLAASSPLATRDVAVSDARQLAQVAKYDLEERRSFAEDPFTKEIMGHPVVIECGHTFDESTIKKWFAKCKQEGKSCTCPLDQKKVSQVMTKNLALEEAILASNSKESKLDALISVVLNLAQKVDAMQKTIEELQKNHKEQQIKLDAVLGTNCITKFFITFGCESYEAVMQRRIKKEQEALAKGEPVRLSISEMPVERVPAMSVFSPNKQQP